MLGSTAIWVSGVVLGMAVSDFAGTAGFPDQLPPNELSEMTFSSPSDAEDFLARELPLATAANPNYRAAADGLETRWLTKSIRFVDAPDGAILVAMDEDYTEIRPTGRTPGTHRAEFSLADVVISVKSDDTQLTPSGEPAVGVFFTCAAPKCIRANWSGASSTADVTDISLQDPISRARILAAFAYLRAHGAKTPT